MKMLVMSTAILAAGSLAAAAPAGTIPGQYIVDPQLPGTTHYDGWLAIDNDGNWESALSAFHSPVGVNFPGTGAWSNPIASKQGSAGHDAEIDKVTDGAGGGPFTSTSSLYFGGFSPLSNTYGGTISVSDDTPIAGLANIVFQIEIGEADGYDFWENGDRHFPVLNYNGGSQLIEATWTETLHRIQTGTFPAPEVGPQPVYQNTFLLQWDVSGITDPIETFEILIDGAQHAQIYAMRLDQSDAFAPIPEPASLGLLASGALLLLRRRRA